MDLQELKNNFELLSSWEDRYAYIIDLGKELPPMDKQFKILENEVGGCTSRVWLVKTDKSSKEELNFIADSDSVIVKGIIALLMIIYDGKSSKEIQEIKVKEIFQELGLEHHLSINRRNGLYSMVKKIKHF